MRLIGNMFVLITDLIQSFPQILICVLAKRIQVLPHGTCKQHWVLKCMCIINYTQWLEMLKMLLETI